MTPRPSKAGARLADEAPNWTGRTVVCVASGPSLERSDVDYCRGKAVVAVVSDNYRMAPWADMLYAGDEDWWTHHWGRVKNLGCVKVSQDRAGAAPGTLPGVLMVRGDSGADLRTKPWSVFWGGNSGFQIIQVAYHCGARRVLLLGYDMQKGVNGERHWFGDHPHGTPLHKPSPFDMFLHAFDCAAEQAPKIGLTIINCSRETAIKKIPRADIRAILK